MDTDFDGYKTESPTPDHGPDISGVRVPRHAKVVDGENTKIGKVRRGVWYDPDGGTVGEFEKKENSVFWERDGEKKGYVTATDDVLTLDGRYVATLRYPKLWLIPLLLVLLLLLSLLSTFIALYYINKSGQYPPVLFVATENGAEWRETEDLPIFLNERFGTNKIAPGQSGEYRFIFENRNADALEYTLTFSCENEYGIGLVYRLNRDGSYIAGADGYVSADELSRTSLTIEAKSSTLFVLEWYWSDSDIIDTRAGENEAEYALTIELNAWVKGADAAA